MSNNHSIARALFGMVLLTAAWLATYVLTAPAMGQSAYFSLEGDLITLADQHDFLFGLSRSVGSGEDLRFVTYTYQGGTNAAGDVIAASLFDSDLRLFDSLNGLRGQDDESGPGFDALLSWAGVQLLDTPLNPDPLLADSYRLNLQQFLNVLTGPWAVDLIGPADAISFTGATPTGTSTVDSLKFGTTGGGTAVYNHSGGTLDLLGQLVVAPSGNATLNLNGGTITVGGLSTVNAGGTINIGTGGTGGTFNANGPMTIDGGSFLRATSGSFNLAAGQTMTIQNGGTFEWGGTIADFFFSGAGKQIDVTGPLSLFRQTDSAGSDGTVFIQSGASIDAMLGGTIEAEYLFVNDGSVTVDGTGSTLDVTAGATSGFVHNVGDGFGAVGSLTLSNDASGSFASVTPTVLELGANSSTGTLDVTSGADLTLQSLDMDESGTSTVTVDGAGSTVTQTQVGTSTLAVGSASGSIATINVTGSGTFTSGTGAITINATGAINIGTGGTGGTFNANGPMTIDGGSLTRTSGFFSLASGGLTLTASNNAQINFTGSHDIRFGTTFDIQSGADLVLSGILDVGIVSDGTLLVDGPGSSVTTGSNISIWGDVGNTADVTFRNGATGNLGAIQLAQGATAGTTGILNVESGATVTTNSLFVVVNGGATTSGTITIDGGGSMLTQNGASTLLLGLLPTGTATINVTDGGTFSTGTGTVTLEPTGTIFIDGGTFNFNGPIVDNGVTLNFLAGAINVAGDFNVGTAGLLGGNLTLSPQKQLGVTGTTTVEAASTLTLTGGTFSTGAIDSSPGGTFNWTNGTLKLTGGTSTLASLVIPDGEVLETSGTTLVGAPVHGGATAVISALGDLTIGDTTSFLGFNFDGSLTVGANTVTLESMGFANLGVLTSIAGGTLSAANGVSLGVGDNLSGNGSVNARIFAVGGSTIAASGGNLTLGDSSAFDGFSSDGVLDTDVHTVTLSDANEAVLGSLTSLGDGLGTAGTLAAANGLVVEFGKNITGHGTIDTPDDPLKPVIQNGHVEGDSMANPITLNGYVKGVGTFNNVVFAGTDDPGFSPAVINLGNAAYASTNMLLIDVGGLTPGDDHDQLNHTGTATLDGALDVALINSFFPTPGETFEIMTFASHNGEFSSVTGDVGLSDPVTFLLPLYSSTNLLLFTAIPGDGNLNGEVGAADYTVWANGFGPGTVFTDGDYNGDGSTDAADYTIWANNFGMMVAAPSSATAAVPEPSTFVLLVIGAIALLWRRVSR